MIAMDAGLHIQALSKHDCHECRVTRSSKFNNTKIYPFSHLFLTHSMFLLFNNKATFSIQRDLITRMYNLKTQTTLFMSPKVGIFKSDRPPRRLS